MRRRAEGHKPSDRDDAAEIAYYLPKHCAGRPKEQKCSLGTLVSVEYRIKFDAVRSSNASADLRQAPASAGARDHARGLDHTNGFAECVKGAKEEYSKTVLAPDGATDLDAVEARWANNRSWNASDVTIGAWNLSVRPSAPRSRGSGEFWSGEHCRTHQRLDIRARKDRQHRISLYDQGMQMCQAIKGHFDKEQRAISFMIYLARDCHMDNIAKADPLAEKDNRQTAAFNSGVNGVLFLPKFRGKAVLEKGWLQINAICGFELVPSCAACRSTRVYKDVFRMLGFRRVGCAQAQLTRCWSVQVVSRDLVYTSTVLFWGRGGVSALHATQVEKQSILKRPAAEISEKQPKSILDKDTQPNNIHKKSRPENHEKAGTISKGDSP